MAFLIIIGLALILLALDMRLAVRGYTVYAERLERPMRIILLADHHSSPYGQEQDKLLKAIYARSPDLILMAGDMFDYKRKPGETVSLFRGLRQYPVYYCVGNHECRRHDFSQIKATAEKYGIAVITDSTVTTEIGGQSLLIGGIEDPEKKKHQDPAYDHRGAMERAFAHVSDAPGYRILLGHRPELIDQYGLYGFDLVVSGHAHGGQVRIPGILNGLWAPGQGFCPKLTGGVYRHGETVQVVSRGLSKATLFPRVFNRPEVVMIDLVPIQGGQERF